MATKSVRSVNVGDIVLIPQTDARFTVGYVLALWPGMEAIMTIALLHNEVDGGTTGLDRLVLDAIATRHVMAVVSTPALPAKKGEWRKSGSLTGLETSDLLPPHPFKTGSLVGARYVTAPLVEGLIEAYRGLSDWDSLLPGRPGYLKSLLYPTGAQHRTSRR